jgi:hypothetical protein
MRIFSPVMLEAFPNLILEYPSFAVALISRDVTFNSRHWITA